MPPPRGRWGRRHRRFLRGSDLARHPRPTRRGCVCAPRDRCAGGATGPARQETDAAHARWDRRLQRLEPDPATAVHVRWMFAQRLDGQSLASIARALNDAGIPCPSGVDPDRNPHRSGDRWTLRTVAAIPATPRYTGRQVWNRQPAEVTPAGRTPHTSRAPRHDL
ncbi:recombinase family protein [Micromonospora sp. NPDC049282]|uniref:recombinase family protein n=1 Tax=Micromonospora sp. NPDC049282 TaxID=3364269 RepID=UPI00371C2BF4